MADNTHLYGFRPVRTVHGGRIPNPVPLFYATGQDDVDDGANSIDINVGDPLKLMNSGGVKVALSDTDVSYVCAGFGPIYNAASGVMEPATKLKNQTAWGTVESRRPIIYGWPARGIIYEIDCDDAVTATTYAAYVALVNANCTWDVPGNTAQTSADPVLDISLVNTTAALGCRIVGVSDTAWNQDFSGNYVKLLVQFNEINDAGAPANDELIVGI